MTSVLAEHRAAVAVDELKRAWHAVRAGQFRGSRARRIGGSAHAGAAQAGAWEPPTTERVLPVLSCAGSCGASTLATALATASGGRSRVVECSSMTASGIAAASSAELGPDSSGWTRGTRGDVLLERVSDVLVRVDEVPVPSTPEGPVDLTVLDVGWELGQVLAVPSWLGDHIARSDTVVLVTTATVPGLRRLEAALDLLNRTPMRGTPLRSTAPPSTVAAANTALAAVVGPPRRRWAKAVEHGTGPLTRAVDRAGHLFVAPHDRALAVAGLTPLPLPAALVAAAAHLLAAAAGYSEGIHDDR